MESWIVSRPDRLDAFLAGEGRMRSRAQAQKAIEAGLVRVNEEKVTRVSERLQEGDAVVLTAPLPQADASVKPVDLHLTVLHEDAASIVINKPAGIAVHPGAGMAPEEVTILHGAHHLFNERSLSFNENSVLVHRLDQDTTGCLLLAKTPEAHRVLQKQFELRSVEKKYLALVAGIPTHSKATVDSPIGRSQTHRTSMSVFGAGKVREAQTTYEVLAEGDRSSLLLCDLHTGRTHQIRVHMHALGHPVLGDSTYSNDLSERLTQEKDIRSLCLHAWTLSYDSPAGGRVTVTAPVASELTRAMTQCGVAWAP